jgi:magnesium-transporting ATPase (P-type)
MVLPNKIALAFAGEPPLKEYMEEKPKKRNEPVINHYMKNQILVTGTYLLLLCLFFLKVPFIRTIFSHGESDIYLMTAFFALFIFMSIFNSFNTRTFRLNLLAHIFKNKGFIGIMLFIIIVQIYLIYYGGNLFRVAGLSINEFWLVLIFAFSVIPVDWVRKLYLRFKKEKGGV